MKKESKVKSTKVIREFSNEHGKFYVHSVEFENKDVGEYTSVSKEQDKFIVGETAFYEIEEKINNQKEKFHKITPLRENVNMSSLGGKQGKAEFDKFNQTGAMVGNAISNAINLICYDKIQLKDLEATAKRICEISMKLKSEFETK